MINNPMQILQMLQSSNNPMALLGQLYGNNPQFEQIMQIIQNKTPKELETCVRNMYQSQNQDINKIASQMGIKI